jgi:hypothetical protein
MMAAPALLDPTDLDDPAKYVPVRVPVFGPHERQVIGPDGQPITIKVTADDLSGIAERTNRAGAGAVSPVRLTIGHPSQHPLHPEHQQTARLIGWSKGAVVAPYKGEPHLWITLYAKRGEERAFAEYPFRSVDYDMAEKRITGVALLLRDPFLNLGAVVYSAPRFTVPYTTRAEDMPLTEEEKKELYDGCVAYFKAKYARLAQYMDDPSSTNTDTPKPGDVQYAKPPEYAALEAENLRLTLERELDGLAHAGVRFDRKKELAALTGMAADKRAEHVAYMKTTYAKLPAAPGFIPVATDEQVNKAAGRAKADDPLAAGDVAKVLAYQKAHGLSYEAALEQYKAKRAA